jgi:hypothetical protein
MPNLLLGLAIAKPSSFTEIANCCATVKPQTNSLHAPSKTFLSFFKFLRLYMPSNGFSEKSKYPARTQAGSGKIIWKNIYLLLAF